MCAVFVHQVHADGGGCRAVAVSVAHFATGRQVDGGNGVAAAVPPVDDVFSDAVVARIDNVTQGEGVFRPFVHGGGTAQTNGGRHIVGAELEAVADALGAVEHGDGDGLVGIAVGQLTADAEAGVGGGAGFHRAAITPVHFVGPAVTIAVFAVAEADQAAEGGAFTLVSIDANIEA